MEKEEASPTGQTPTVPHSHQVKADSEADDLSQLQSKTEQQNDPSQPDTAPEPVSGQKAASVTHQTENPSDKATAEGTGGDGEGGAGEEVRVPREHGRLDVLLSQIPKKAQHGLLRQCDLILTCIDANHHFIAMGTNIGLTFLYSRCQHTVQRLRSESSSDVVSCVQLHEGIDHQVAVGTASGALSIFFIPGAMSANTKQLEKFEVKSMHRYYITCVVWSTNGMKLFSGDKSGQVVVTEVDFYQGQCKSSVLLVEPPTEIVQLHYNHRVLLVSTRHRSFLCRLDTTGHTTQIGQKDRKVQGNYGAVLLPGLCKTEDAQLYAVRPGCRIWLSDIHGNVLNTLMFKELVGSSHPDIPLLHPSPRSSAHNLDLQFGRVLMYSGDQLVTYNASTLFILHPHRSVVVASQSQLGGIVDVAVYQDEIFILRRHTDSAVIRIAYQPEALLHAGMSVCVWMGGRDVSVCVVASQSQLGGIVDVAVYQDEIFILRRHTDSAVIRIAYQPEALLHAGISPDKPLDTSSSKSSGSSNGSSSGEKGVVEEEENKAKQFFKKTFLSPFKKLDTFLQEHAQNKEAELDLRPVIRSDPEQAPVKQSLPEQAPVKQSLPEQDPVKQSHPEQTPVMRSHPEQALPQTGPPPSGPLPPSQDSSPDLPPVVPLDFPDLTMRIFAGANNKGSSGSVSSPGDVQSPDSAHSALSVFAEEAGDRGVESTTGPPAAAATADAAKVASEGETEESSGQVKNNDNNNDSNQGIIFSHHMQKKRGKKKKAKGKPVKDSDTLSQSSLGSQTGDDRKGDIAGDHRKGDDAGDPRKGDHAAGGHPKEIDEVLHRAEEALNSAGKLLNTATDGTDGDTDSTSASTTTIPKQAREGDSEEGAPAVTDGSGGEGQKAVGSNASVRAQTVGDTARGTQGTTTHAVSDVRSDETDSRRSGLDESKTSSKQQKLSSEQQKLPSEQQKPSPQQHTPVSSPLAAKKVELDSASQRTAPGNNSSVPPAKSDSRTPYGASPKPGAGTSANSSRAEAESRTPAPRDKDGRVPTLKEGEDAMAAAERTLDSMTQRYSLPVKKQDSADDFYSMFASPYSPTDPLESPPLTPSLTSSSSVESDRHSAAERGRSSGSRSSEGGGGAMEGSLQKLANSWSEFTAPANIYSLALSSSHVWFTDKSENLYYSALGGVKGMVWRKVGESAGQVAVSPSGHIVWRLHRGRVFAGTKITHRRPEGLKWVEAVNNVAHIAVDDHCAWYVKTSGEVMMQRGLSKERPCFRSVTVGEGVGVGVRQVMARHGVVWALTDDMTLLVRTGITNDTPHGTAWYQVDRRVEPCLFCSVSVDSEGIGWATDVLGQVWFTDHVTPHNPVGSGKWWQVPLSECYVQAPSVVDMLRSLARRWDRRTLTAILNTRRGSIITAGDQGVWLALDHLNTLYVCRGSLQGDQGVWLALDHLNTLYVCRGSLQGYHWSMAQPSQMADSTMWKQVNAAMAHLSWGLVWAQQDNGELYAIPPDSSDATLTPTPGPDPLLSLAANRHSLWGLDSQGALHVRGGLGQHCPLGLDWVPLDLLQLGDVFLVHVSCNNNYVWVVDGEGRVFHCIGAAAPRPGQLNPVWLPIDVYTEIIFTKVVIGLLDWMVWAVDNRRLTYVRVGVGDDMPIGKEWIHVPGIQAMDVCVSGVGVWALNTSGELLFRYGITPLNPSGNYWKKAPGCFTRISASYEDALWAVTTAGQLVKCSCRHLTRCHDDHDPLLLQRSASVASEEGEWELV
ncbi:hypothetical protein ACOMHN_058643 [Nucella lapillus]